MSAGVDSHVIESEFSALEAPDKRRQVDMFRPNPANGASDLRDRALDHSDDLPWPDTSRLGSSRRGGTRAPGQGSGPGSR